MKSSVTVADSPPIPHWQAFFFFNFVALQLSNFYLLVTFNTPLPFFSIFKNSPMALKTVGFSSWIATLISIG